jgi:hypothetical protein
VACFDVGAVVPACLGMLLAVESRVIGVQVSLPTTLMSLFVGERSALTI